MSSTDREYKLGLQRMPGKSGLVLRIILSSWYIPVILLLAAALRLTWILTFPKAITSDFAFYFRTAEAIARGEGYCNNGFLTAYFPIGYPLFLSGVFRLFSASVSSAQIANLILSVAWLFLAYRIAGKLFGSEVVARISLLFLALYPNNVAYPSLIGVEIVNLFLLFLGFTLIIPSLSVTEEVRFGRLIAAGLIFGCAVLVKAQTILLPGLLFLVFTKYSWDKKVLNVLMKKIAILYITVLVVICPWIVRNYGVYDAILLSNNDGENLYIGNGPEANGTWVQTPSLDAQSNTLDEFDFNQIARREAIQYMKIHPWHTLALLPAKFLALFDRGDGIYWTIESAVRSTDVTRSMLELIDDLNWFFELIVFISFLPAIFFIWRNKSRFPWQFPGPSFGIVVSLYFISIYLVYYGSPRYSLPVVPWMIMCFAAMVSLLLPEVGNKVSSNE